MHQGDNQVVRIETDANFKLDREKRIAIRFDPLKLDVATESYLHEGRKKYRLRPTKDAVAGDTGQVIATITRWDGSQLEANVPFEILAPRPGPSGQISR